MEPILSSYKDRMVKTLGILFSRRTRGDCSSERAGFPATSRSSSSSLKVFFPKPKA